MGSKAERYFIPIVVGFAPVILALVTWPVGEPTRMRDLVLTVGLPLTVAEVFVIVIAFREGLSGYLRIIPRPAVVALAAWLAVGIGASLLLAPMGAVAIRWTVLWVIHLLFGLSVAYLCTRQLRLQDFIVCYLAAFVVYNLIFVIFVIDHWGQPIDWVHYLPGAIHIRHVAIYAAAMTGMSIGVMAGARSRRAWGLAFAVATLGFAVGFWTGARGMVVSVAGATILAALFIPAMRGIRVLAAAALSLGAGFAAVAWLPTPNAEMMGVARQVAATTEQEMTTGRLEMWSKVVAAIARNPIFGYGPGQMPAVARHSTMGQPHNLVLQVVLDWGLIGLACVLVVSFYYLRRAIPAVRRDGDLLAAPAMAMLSLLILSMFDAAMFHVLPLSIFACCAGMIASRWPSREGAQA